MASRSPGRIWGGRSLGIPWRIPQWWPNSNAPQISWEFHCVLPWKAAIRQFPGENAGWPQVGSLLGETPGHFAGSLKITGVSAFPGNFAHRPPGRLA